jgi:hypothetical protein
MFTTRNDTHDAPRLIPMLRGTASAASPGAAIHRGQHVVQLHAAHPPVGSWTEA